MHYFEVMLVVSILTVGIIHASFKYPYSGRRFTVWSVGMGLGYVVWGALALTERRSWRMAPAFVALFILSVVGLEDRNKRRVAESEGAKSYIISEKWPAVFIRRTAGALGIAMALVSLVAALVFPIKNLPAPTGPYQVGTASFEVVDDTRTGVYLDAPGTPRRLMAQAWYPAEAGAATLPRAPWIADRPVTAAYADYVGLPHWTMAHLSLILTNGRTGAPAAADTGAMPVVIISHGWTGTRAMHADLAEELASRGIVAVVVDHPYGALSVSFPDGTVAPLFRGALPDREKTPDFDSYAATLVATYAADIAAVARRVRAGDTVPQLAGRLDASRIAFAGHSTGGGAAVLAAMDDPAVAGVVGLDAWVEPIGARLATGLKAAQLHIGSASWKGGINAGHLATLERASGSWDAFRIPGSGHADFAMIRHVTSVGSWIGLAGKGNGFAFARTVTPLVCDWLQALLHDGLAAARGGLPERYRDVYD